MLKRRLYEEKIKGEVESLCEALKEVTVENEFVANLQKATESTGNNNN